MAGADTRSASLSRIERFLVGDIRADQLSLNEFAVWLDGYLTRQREIDDLHEEVRRRDAIDSRRAPFDMRPLLQPTFAELSRIRREPARAARAELASRQRNGDAA